MPEKIIMPSLRQIYPKYVKIPFFLMFTFLVREGVFFRQRQISVIVLIMTYRVFPKNIPFSLYDVQTVYLFGLFYLSSVAK